MSFSEAVHDGVMSIMQATADASEYTARQKKGENKLIDRVKDDIAPMKQKMLGYDKLVRRCIIDTVPRYVGKWLLKELEVLLLVELQDALLEGDAFNDLLSELPELEMKRGSLNEELKCLQASASVLRKPFGNA